MKSTSLSGQKETTSQDVADDENARRFSHSPRTLAKTVDDPRSQAGMPPSPLNHSGPAARRLPASVAVMGRENQKP
jgi:hypothetical protein